MSSVTVVDEDSLGGPSIAAERHQKALSTSISLPKDTWVFVDPDALLLNGLCASNTDVEKHAATDECREEKRCGALQPTDCSHSVSPLTGA